MRTYILSTPKDEHGQPIRLFRANLENNVSKAIDQLSGICSGILADGVVGEAEANVFAEYVRKFAVYEPVWPFTDVLARVERIFADARCEDDERDELKSVMEALCGYRQQAKPEDTYSTTLPLDEPPPKPIIFQERNFVVTGRFAFGTRRKVTEAISSLGGTTTDFAPTQQTHYLVIGLFASRDWANTNYGRKIQRAVKLRDSGSGIAIISEEHWKSQVELSREYQCSTSAAQTHQLAGSSERFYIYIHEEVKGPYTRDQLTALFTAQAIASDTMCCPEGLVEWQAYETIKA